MNAPTASELKQQLDCRDVARSLIGDLLKRSRPRYDQYLAPRGEKHESLTVWADGYKDHATGQHGSVIDLPIYTGHAADFKTAYELILSLSGGAIPTPHKNFSFKPKDTSAAPSPDWQIESERIVSAAIQAIGSPAGRAGLEYLHSRGLTDDTIRAFKLGFSRGRIVIPHYFAGQLWAIQYRHLFGDLRYTSEDGSKLSAGLFNGDAITPDKPAMLFEGAFDAMLAAQEAGDLVTPVSVNSCSNHASPRALEALRRAKRVILAYDNDDKGREHTEKNTPGLPKAYAAVYVPAGKDATEYVKIHGGDLRQWVVDALVVPIIINNQHLTTAGLPPTWRAAFNAYTYPAIPLVIEMWKQAIAEGLADPDEPQSVDDLIDLAKTTGRNVSESTIRRATKLDAGQFLAVCPLYDPSQKESSYSGQTANNSTPGRKTTYYKLRSDDEIKAELIEQGIDRITDEYFHRDDPMVAPIHADVFKALGLSHDKAAAMVEQLTADGYADVIAAQPGLSERIKTYRNACERLIFSLQNTTPAPIPASWQYRNAAEYAACCARAIAVAAGGETNLGKPDWSIKLGKSPRSIKRILKNAAIEDKQTEPEAQPVTSAASLPRNFTYWHKAIIVTDGDRKSLRGLYQADREQVAAFVENQLAAGRKVDLMVQGKNRQRIGGDLQPIKAPRQPVETVEITDPEVETTSSNQLPEVQPDVKRPRPAVKPYFGRGFNPDNWRDWPGKLLVLKGWRFDGNELISPDGEIVEYEPLAALELLKPMARVDNPAAFIAQQMHRKALIESRNPDNRLQVSGS